MNMMTSRRHRMILCNDGGTLVGATREAPIGEEGLVALTIDPLRDTQIDTFYWQLGTDPYLGTPSHRLTDQYSHDTSIGPIWGQGGGPFSSASNWRIYENARELTKQGTDPARVVIEHGHRAGLEVFLSMRVNDIHDGMYLGELNDPLMSPMKQSHPDWLLGGTGRSRFSYNFSLPEVREYRLGLAMEAINNYDIDGLDWDFCRYPTLFRSGEVEDGKRLITETIQRLRDTLDEKSTRIGRQLLLSIRVPGGLSETLSAGIDVETLVRDKLIDILIVGHAIGNKHRLPVEEYVQAAEGSKVEVIAQNLGLFMQGRPWSARMLWGERDYYSTEMCRATAAAHWRAGADGIYLFNNHLISVARDLAYNRQPWKEIADPQLIERLDKHYLVDQPTLGDDPPGCGGRRFSLRHPLITTLEEPGDEAEVSIDLADDIASATRDGAVRNVCLRILVEQFTNLDELEVHVNDTVMPKDESHTKLLFNDAWIEYEASDVLTQGWNRIRFKVKRRNSMVQCPLAVKSVEILVNYNDVSL